MRFWSSQIVAAILGVSLLGFDMETTSAQELIPGSGVKLSDAGDDFEDLKWAYTPQHPKSSYNIDKQDRYPRGESSNGIWFESTKRGHPDVIRIVATPKGGLPGSQGALLMQTLQSGIPGSATSQQQQDDFIMEFNPSIGASIPVSWSPSTVIRVYFPPFRLWEQRTGATFGWRASVTGIGPLEENSRRRGIGRFFRRNRPSRGVDSFYPGIFIQFVGKADSDDGKDSAVLLIRGDDNGQDVLGPKITQPGWWTLGMSFSPDGRVHYYARPGVDDLTSKDHIASYFSQSVRCQQFNTIFFNVVNQDDGKSWSTPWVIDDPSVYTLHNPTLNGQSAE